jgi:hypothetical protein
MTTIAKNHACRLKVCFDYLDRACERLIDPVADVGHGHTAVPQRAGTSVKFQPNNGHRNSIVVSRLLCGVLKHRSGACSTTIHGVSTFVGMFLCLWRNSYGLWLIFILHSNKQP